MRNVLLPYKIVMLLVIPRAHAQMEKVSNVHLVMVGTVAGLLLKIVLNLVMIKIAPELEKVAQVKPATENINHALAILVINTPAPAPGTPAVPDPLVVESTPPAPVHQATSGKTELVLALDQCVKLVLYTIVITPVHLV